MTALRRIVLIRHGNTVGNSHERFHGSSDVGLSEEGRRQVREAGRRLRQEVFDLVVASPLRRSWESAALLAGGAPVRLVPEFREIHFGRWEGLTKEEIQERDPSLFQAWQEDPTGFEYPGGEPRAQFQARVLAGLESLQGFPNVLAVVHKGVIRTIAAHLLGEALAEGTPDLGGVISLSRAGDKWHLGRRSSNPPALEELTAAEAAA